MVGLGFILAFAGIVLLISALIGAAKARSFAKCSESVTGKVGNKYVHHGKHQRYYSMEILYTVDGTDYKRSVPADLSEHNTLMAGDPFELKYKPDNPKKIIRADNLKEKNTKALRVIMIIGAVLTVIGIALIFNRFLTGRM